MITSMSIFVDIEDNQDSYGMYKYFLGMNVLYMWEDETFTCFDDLWYIIFIKNPLFLFGLKKIPHRRRERSHEDQVYQIVVPSSPDVQDFDMKDTKSKGSFLS